MDDIIIKILEDDEETFRSIYDIFLDISKVYKDMSDTDASALLDLIAGKNRASAISATLNNMAEAQEILQNSLHAAGSAQKEYNTYLESTEAHIQRFKATLTETYTSFLDGNMVSHVVDIGTAVLDLNNKSISDTIVAHPDPVEPPPPKNTNTISSFMFSIKSINALFCTRQSSARSR